MMTHTCLSPGCSSTVSTTDAYCGLHAPGTAAPERVTPVGAKERLMLAFARGALEALDEGGAPALQIAKIERLARACGLRGGR